MLSKTSRSFTNLSGGKRQFLTMYVYEHFKLDMCTYGGKACDKTVIDVFWKEGCRVPEVLASEIAALIGKGIISKDHEATRNAIFEASLGIYGIPKGTGLDDIKKLLRPFKDEFYAERKVGASGSSHPVFLHFYEKTRAKDAQDFLRGAAHHFGEVELISHRKEIGTNPLSPADEASAQIEPKKKRQDREFDHDGFEIIR